MKVKELLKSTLQTDKFQLNLVCNLVLKINLLPFFPKSKYILLSSKYQITISKDVEFNIVNDKILLDFDVNKKISRKKMFSD